jgi:hypothetical protein
MPQALSASGVGNAYPFCAAIIRFVREMDFLARSRVPRKWARYGPMRRD